ncbi:MAG: GHMP family kinase ATP-binding protein [Candidatus Hodarchaeales archaeon]|jgi:galactokinase
MEKNGHLSSPGRICFFGEHQDYLGLPVIPIAINRRLNLKYSIQEDKLFMEIHSTQLNSFERLSLVQPPTLTGSLYDYIRAVFQYFWKDSEYFKPMKILIESDIPIRAGLSSSAALLTSMVFLVGNIMLDQRLTPRSIAEIAYICEHEKMGIACGKMDQYSSALGGIFHMIPNDIPNITPLNWLSEAFFVIGNSGIIRKADIPLKHIQQDIFNALSILGNPSLQMLTKEEINPKKMSHKLVKRLLGVIGIRNITRKALEELRKTRVDLHYIGKLITSQQVYLKENYQVSNQILDKMCEISLKRGALGAKLTGAGFGGCMFALTDEEEIAYKIKQAIIEYDNAFIVRMDSGVRKHSL